MWCLFVRVKIAKADDLKPGQAKSVDVNGRAIALFNVKGEFFAVDDSCTHMGAPLANGMLAGKTVTCEWHGACFNLESGEAETAPARGDVRAYKVFTVNDELEIDLD